VRARSRFEHCSHARSSGPERGRRVEKDMLWMLPHDKIAAPL